MTGLPLVFLPGAAGRAAGFEPAVGHLRKDREIRLVPYPGLDECPARAEVDSLEALRSFVLASLPARFDLVAMSMGCVLALKTALEQPDRIRRLVLIAPTGGIDVVALGASEWRAEWTAKKPDAPRWFVDDRSDFTARLQAVAHPTLVIVGDADPLSPVAAGNSTARMPAARLEIVRGGTHDLELEQPDVVARAIQSHVDG